MSQLDYIDNMNFVIRQVVHKGKSAAETMLALEKKDVSPDQIKIIIENFTSTYRGVRRLESSNSNRLFNYLVDSIVLVFLLVLITFVFLKHVPFVYVILLFLVLPFLYYFLMEFYSGQTLGKIITGNIVVDQNGEIPNGEKTFTRTICRLIPVDILFLIISDRLLHDRIPETYVVNKKRWKEQYHRPDEEQILDSTIN